MQAHFLPLAVTDPDVFPPWHFVGLLTTTPPWQALSYNENACSQPPHGGIIVSDIENVSIHRKLHLVETEMENKDSRLKVSHIQREKCLGRYSSLR